MSDRPVDPPSTRRTPTGEVDETLIADAVGQHMDERPVRLIAQATKPPRLVYEAQFTRRPPVFFKGEYPTGEDDAIVLECWAMDAARRAGTPTPEVMALDTSQAIFPGRFAIFERAPGVPLSTLAKNDAMRLEGYRSAGHAIRLAHGVPVAGFGRLDDAHYLDTGEVQGERATWRTYALDRARAAIPTLLAANALNARPAAVFERALTEAEPLFDMTDARLVHGDLDETHIFVDPGTGALTSIIDWGDREASEPAWDLAVLLLWDGRGALNAVLEGYIEDAGEPEDLRARIEAYTLAFGLLLADWQRDQGRIRRARQTIADVCRVMGIS
jgi:aminoglycoside phosphotransferase (APT) family kinase protein